MPRACNYTGYKDLSGSYWVAIKNRAFKKQIIFDIDIEYAWYLFISQNRKCALSGLDIYLSPNLKKKRNSASLDRINNDLGYIYGNVQWLHKDVNNIKGSMSKDLMLYYCKSICYVDMIEKKRDPFI